MRAALCTFLLLVLPASLQARTCPPVIDSATELVLITTTDMQASMGKLVLYSRESRSASWRQLSAGEPVRLGEHGLAWGPGFMQLARRSEPVKRESDWRTPAGIYRIGAPFGFAASTRRGYIRIKPGETLCVDDRKSPAYNTITTTARVGSRVHGEHMADYPEYRHGLLIDYPSTYAQPADSCIFVHAWTTPGESTAGCVALPEARVIALQNFAEHGAVIAIVPRPALDRFAGCLPDADSR